MSTEKERVPLKELRYNSSMKNNNTPEVNESLTIGELYKAIDVVIKASRQEATKRAVIEMLSDNFNPEMFSMIGTVNDNYSDTLENMRRAFGI